MVFSLYINPSANNIFYKNTYLSYHFKVSDIPDENDQTSNYVRKIRKAYDNYKDILNSHGDITENS